MVIVQEIPMLQVTRNNQVVVNCEESENCLVMITLEFRSGDARNDKVGKSAYDALEECCQDIKSLK